MRLSTRLDGQLYTFHPDPWGSWRWAVDLLNGFGGRHRWIVSRDRLVSLPVALQDAWLNATGKQ